MNVVLPLDSQVCTESYDVIKNLETEEKDVLEKKNTFKFKGTLAPLYTQSENKVYTTSGHKLSINNNVIEDEYGRTYTVKNDWTIDYSIDITNLWSGKLTSAFIASDNTIYSVWQSESTWTLVISDQNNKILNYYNVSVNQNNLLYYNVKLTNFVTGGNVSIVEQAVYSNNQTIVKVYDRNTSVRNTYTYNFLTGQDLYVLTLSNGTLVVGTDDTDIRKRFTFLNGTLRYKYWGCLGSNGLLTGEPVLVNINSRSTGLLSSKSIEQFDFGYLDNGLAYGQQVNGSTDSADINANSSLNNNAISSSDAANWGGVNHTRVDTRAICVGVDLVAGIPLLLTPNISNTRAWSGSCKSEIRSIDSAYFTANTVSGNNLVVEQVDFTDGWGNVTWNNGTASISNGCNPFPYKYMIMNRAESKGRYWSYGPGWVRTYFRQGIIKYRTAANTTKRAFVEEYPTSIISFGLSSINGKNSVRVEYLDPIKLVSGTNEADGWKVAGWSNDSSNTGYYYKHHNINDNEAHIWANFMGADNLADHSILSSFPFNVDLNPSLNIKDQYYGLTYQSTSMQSSLLTSASISNNSDSMLIVDTSYISVYSNGLIVKLTKNGKVKLSKVADYIYRTNTLTGNNLFIDDGETILAQRGFIPFNGEEIITLDEINKLSPIDDNNLEGNDTYYTGSGYNINMTDMRDRAVSYILPATTVSLIVNSEETEDFTYQLSSNKKEITKPLLYNQFTFKDKTVDHYYTHALDTNDIHYQTGKKLESTTSGNTYTDIFGIATYDIDKAGFSWYVTSEVYFFPMGLASIVSGINYLASTVDMTDNYTVRLYRTQNITFPVYNPNTEVYKGSTIFTIYGYNYSFDGQSVYYLGSGDTTGESSFACYALGMRFLANSGTEAYFYSPFEKKVYMFTGSNTLQMANSLAKMGDIVDSLYSSNEQILYLLDDKGNIIARSQSDMCIIPTDDTDWHFEGTETGMILAKDWGYKTYRLYKTDETEWLPFEFETEYLGKSDNLYKVSALDVSFYKGEGKSVGGTVGFIGIHDNMPTKEVQNWSITAKQWQDSNTIKLRFVPKDNTVKAFKFSINSDDYIYISNITVVTDVASENTNSTIHV